MNHEETRCFDCSEGALRRQVVTHDVGALLGVESVTVENMPAAVCDRCGWVAVDGRLLDDISMGLAAFILSQPVIDPDEARYLRRLLGDTQEELAEHLNLSRATVNRWETDTKPLDGASAYALRAHAFLRLQSKSPIIQRAAAALREILPPRQRRRPYRLNAAECGFRAAV